MRRQRKRIVRIAALCFTLLTALPVASFAQSSFPVGIRQIEFVDTRGGNRHLALFMFYPAIVDTNLAKPFTMPFFTNLHLYMDAPMAAEDTRHPLVMLSHGRGSNGLLYAWFAEGLASHGYVVAALNHYRANTWDSTIEYLANRLWQRPVDLSLSITFLLNDPVWGRYIDANRIGVAGHSQGGFTSLWIAGARINPVKYLAFQRNWRNNQMVPEYLRQQLPLDAGPATDVHDARVKAAFAMAPGLVRAFGMDADGLRELRVPAYIAVGAGDTQTPPKDNAEFAAKYIPDAKLNIIPGRVDHEIFVNECNQDGKDEFPEACVDAPGVDRGQIHVEIGKAALDFFNTSLKGR